MNIFRNYKLWLILSVVLAVSAGIAAVFAIRAYVGTVPVLAAKADIQDGHIMMKEDLTTVDCAKGNLYPDTLTDVKEVIGLAAKGYIPAGTILRGAMFAPAEDYKTASLLKKLGKDYRAIAIPNSILTNVAGMLNPGDKVTVYVISKNFDKKLKLLSNCLVLQSGTIQTPDGTEETPGIVLALPEKDAEVIIDYLPGGKREATFVVTLQPVEAQAKHPAPEEQKTTATAELKEEKKVEMELPDIQEQIKKEVERQLEEQQNKTKQAEEKQQNKQE